MAAKKTKKKAPPSKRPAERKFPPAKKGDDWIRPDEASINKRIQES
jgi:hypothetical protein